MLRHWFMLGLVGSIGILHCHTASAQASDWKVKADPPPDKVTWPEKPTIKIPAPKSFFDAELTFADQGGPFVALGRNGGKDERREFFDLRTGRKIGTLRGEGKMERPQALSPDGQLFAAAHGQGKGGFMVIDTAAGKTLRDISTEKKPDYLEFAGKDRILALSNWGDSVVQQFEARTGKELQSTRIVKDWRKGFPVASPGGSFMAVADGKLIYFYDLGTGGEVAQVDVPAGKNGPAGCHALAFSPDGSQLAGLFEDWGEFRVAVWDLKDGNKSAEVTVEKPKAAFYEGRKIDWSPDGTSWLINGELVVDRETGKTLWKLPEDPFQKMPRRIIAAEAVVHLDAKDRNNRTLVTASQAKDKVATIRKTLKEGGSATDAQLPPLKATDLKDAKIVQVPLSSNAWAVNIEPRADAPQLARRPIPVSAKGSQIESVRVVSGAKPSAIIELVNRAGAFGQVDDTQGRRVGRLDLTTGKLAHPADLPPGCQVIGIGSDGGSVLTSDIQDGRRVDVWSLETGKHVLGWRPYQQDADKEQKVTLARAISPDQIVTVSVAGKVILWSFPDCRPVYVAEVPDFTAVTIAPGDKFLVGLQRGIVRFIEIATGKLAGDLEPPFPPLVDANAPKVLALRPDGKEAAAILGKAGEAPHLIRWDLSTGKMVYDASFRHVAPTGVKLAYAGPKHMLIDERELFDLERKASVWNYALQPPNEGKFAVERPDNRCWYAVATGFNQEGSALVAATLPEFDVEKYVQTIADGPNALLRPGTRLSIQVNFIGAESGEARTKTLEVLRQSLERRGLKVSDGADMVLQLSVTERDTGEKLEFRKMFPHFGDNPFATKSVNIIELDCQSKLLVSGQETWKSNPEKMSMRHIFGIVHLPNKDTDVGRYLHSQLWGNVPAWADRAALPRFLARSNNGVQALPGNSTLGASGVQTGNPTVPKK